MSEKRHSSLGIHGPLAVNGTQRLAMLQRSRRLALIALGVLGIGTLIVLGLRFSQASTLAQVAREQAVRYVKTVAPMPASGAGLLRLPGTLQGYTEAPIYARTSGYVSRWYKDIGESVKKGDLLAQIDTPEVTQQLLVAQAELAQSKNHLELAQRTFERWESLHKINAVSQQEFEERRNVLAVAVSAAASSAATVRRLQEQLAYSRIVAPFDGVVTKRNIDIGNLVDAGGGSQLLFALAKSDVLRVYIQVPQSYAAQVKNGDKALITLKEMPGQVFEGKIVRSAGAIDTQTRTLQAEVNLPNPDGRLLPGAYVQVAIHSAAVASAEILSLPSNTLLFRPEGLRAAVVGADSKVQLLPVSIVRELGNQVEVSGLRPEYKVILNPSDALIEGDLVNVVAETPAKAAPSSKGGKGGKADAA